MDMIKIGCLGLAGVMLGLFLRQIKSPYADLISLATCLLIVFYSVTKIAFIFELIQTLNSYIAVQQGYLKILLKIIGITYVAEFSSSLCKDAGCSAIAGQIEIFGKISILAVSSPIITALLETVYALI